MANSHIPSALEVTRYENQVIAQREAESFWSKLIGGEGDADALVFKSPERFKNTYTWRVPLLKAVTADALEDGADYEGQGNTLVYSYTDIVKNERGQVFGTIKEFENDKAAFDIREDAVKQAGSWHTQDFDKKLFSIATLAYASLPTKAARDTSQYNVHFCGDATSWGTITAAHKLTRKEIAKGKMYFYGKRGLRPCKVGNFYGGVLVLPPGAAYDLYEEDSTIQEQLLHALPSSEDHQFFKGRGLNPTGYVDGVLIVTDQRPVYGGDDGSFLITQDQSTYQRFEGLFLGAQALAYGEWKPITYFEREFQHGRNVEISVHSVYGAEKPVINLGTLNSSSNRDYGVGYIVGGCTRPW
jgi:hypothetical protein